MAAYPNIHHTEFMKRVRLADHSFQSSRLSTLLGVLTSNTGTAQAVKQAVAGLSRLKTIRYADALNYLRWTYPGAPTCLTQAAAGLLEVLVDRHSSDSQVQRALDRLDVAGAKANVAAIRALIADRPAVEYVGLEAHSAAYTGNFLVDKTAINQNSVKYTSRHFHGKVVAYSIVPANITYDMGFIQVCDSRTQKQTFSDDGLETRWENTGRLPKSDSSSNQNIPWYHVGLATACTHPTARKAFNPTGSKTFELDDNFNAIGTHYELVYRKRGQSQRTVIKTIARKQRFTAWFAYKRHSATTYRIVRKIVYGFDFTINFSLLQNVLNHQLTQRNVAIVESTPARNAGLPGCALRGPTTNAGDVLRVYANDRLLGSINQQINI